MHLRGADRAASASPILPSSNSVASCTTWIEREHRYNVPEAPTIGRLIDGLRHVYSRDEELLAQGMVLFEALYRAFAGEVVADRASQRQRRGRHREKGR